MAKVTAVLFRRKIYVRGPRHLDALNAAFERFTQHQVHRIYNRVADGKEEIVFGFANADGTGWEFSSDFQDARKIMYGFD